MIKCIIVLLCDFFATLSKIIKIDGKIEMQSIYYAFLMNKYRLKRKYFYCYG